MHRDMHNTVGLRDVIIDSNEKCTRELVEICSIGSIGDVCVQEKGPIRRQMIVQSVEGRQRRSRERRLQNPVLYWE